MAASQFVYRQAREALSRSGSKVSATLFVEPLPRSKIDDEYIIEGGGPGNTVWLVNPDTNLVEVGFDIDVDCWRCGNSDLEVKDFDKAYVDPKFAIVARYEKTYRASDIFRNPLISFSSLFVHNPRRIVEATFATQDLPSDDWLKRYKRFRIDVGSELLSVCWRYVHVQQKIPKHGLMAELIRIMRSYLDRQGFDGRYPEEDALRQIATTVYQQMEAKDINSKVIS